MSRKPSGARLTERGELVATEHGLHILRRVA